jgi:hypothetical protein
MKSPPIQIHDDIARERLEAFIRGEDDETLVGTEAPTVRSKVGTGRSTKAGRGAKAKAAAAR